MALLNDLSQNILKSSPSRRDSEDTYAAAFIIRTFSTCDIP
jgi:hypothetical protein